MEIDALFAEIEKLKADIAKLKALGDVLRWNTSKLQDDTIESIGGLIFDISRYLLEKLNETHDT